MRGFVIGIAMGAAVAGGLTRAAGQQPQPAAGARFLSGAQLVQGERCVRLGYAAGAHDMLVTLRAMYHNKEVADEQKREFLDSRWKCLQDRAGGNLGKLAELADPLWRGQVDSGADILLFDACKP
jgi:hypothetical protein